jgi:hypothetical protein
MRHGAMILQLDDGPAFNVFTDRDAQDDPVYMDRFGLFNLQMYHQYLDLYLTDLTVNGHKLDLTKDPAWEGQGNRIEFAEQDFQRESFGYSETNWAGEGIGEVGGVFTGLEPEELYQGQYVDDVGKLTLDDPISFSGSVCFVHDSTDAGMLIGFFDDKVLNTRPTEYAGGQRIPSSLGILVEGGARGGKHFNPQFISPNKDDFRRTTGPSFLPTRERHAFKFDYDPKSNNNLGRVTLTIGDQTCTLDLTAQQRKSGAVFDRFGLANMRGGGKYVEVYFDDLIYTARRPKDYQPIFHKQEVTKVPYPKGGRAF